MLEDFSTWPQDALVIFVALIIGLSNLIAGTLIKAGNVKNDDGYIHVKAGHKAYTMTFGLVLVATSIIYSASQAREDQQFIASLIALTAFLGTGFHIYKTLFKSLSFNKETLISKKLFQDAETLSWNDCDGAMYKNGSIRIGFGNKLISVVDALSGARQLNNMIALRFSSIDTIDCDIKIDADALKEMKGKTIILTIKRLDEDYNIKADIQLLGEIKTAAPNGLKVAIQKGQETSIVTIPANSGAIVPYNKDQHFGLLYEELHDTEPDYISEWATTDRKWTSQP